MQARLRVVQEVSNVCVNVRYDIYDRGLAWGRRVFLQTTTASCTARVRPCSPRLASRPTSKKRTRFKNSETCASFPTERLLEFASAAGDGRLKSSERLTLASCRERRCPRSSCRRCRRSPRVLG